MEALILHHVFSCNEIPETAEMRKCSLDCIFYTNIHDDSSLNGTSHDAEKVDISYK